MGKCNFLDCNSSCSWLTGKEHSASTRAYVIQFFSTENWWRKENWMYVIRMEQSRAKQDRTKYDNRGLKRAGQGSGQDRLWNSVEWECRAGQDMVSHEIACHGTIQQIRMEQIKRSKAEQRWEQGGSTVQPVDRLSQRWAQALTHSSTSPIFHVCVPLFHFLIIFVAGSIYSRTVFYYLILSLLYCIGTL